MYWKHVGIYSISPYGHPVHSKFATPGGATLTLKWRDTEGRWHLTEDVSKSWYDNTRPETGIGANLSENWLMLSDAQLVGPLHLEYNAAKLKGRTMMRRWPTFAGGGYKP
jgi:hypothetical protein